MKNKVSLLIVIFTLFALLISACGGQNAPAPAAGEVAASVSAAIDTSYEGALPLRNQLALGSLKLAGTENEITPQQAASLIPLWQALRSTTQSGGSADAEVNALLEQIQTSLTPEQLAAIGGMKLAQTDIQEWAKTNGITLGSGGGQPGSGQGLSPEARATRQAEEGRTDGGSGGGGGASTAILEALIAYLQELAS